MSYHLKVLPMMMPNQFPVISNIYKGHPDQRFGPVTYSQNGEDLMILSLCELLDLQCPTYLDLGAHDPFTISNTALLYSRGSYGVNIDANINVMDEFMIHRVRDVNVCVGVSANSAKPRLFHLVDPKSGLNTFCEDKIPRPFTSKSTVLVNMMTVNEVVMTYCPGGIFPDLLFTDLEGLDLEVLDSMNLERSYPKIICSEIRKDETEKAITNMLYKGYSRVCRMGENLIFIANELRPLCR
jgi:hypothetical protein